jgi:DNA-binding LacI/PurR family transcriptional regulator
MSTHLDVKAKTRRNHNALLTELRRRILAGELAPGAQLPTRLELAQEFQASPHTLQRAVDHLRRDGFLSVVARQATYVTKHLPNRFHFAMVFTSRPSVHGAWNRFFQTLANAATHYDGSDAEPRRISVHVGVDNHADNQEMKVLLHAINTQSLAGLIFPEEPFVSGLAETPLMTRPGIPRVAFRAEPIEPDTAAVTSDGAVLEKALDHLAAQGCRRIAVLGNLGSPTSEEATAAAIRGRGMILRPHWFLMLPAERPECARKVVHLLLHAGQPERPDGMLIADDNLAEYAQMGIVDSGIKVGEELRLVIHCNFPSPAPNVLPARRLGYDARTALGFCLELLEEVRQGKPPGARVLPAVFEDGVEVAPGMAEHRGGTATKEETGPAESGRRKGGN